MAVAASGLIISLSSIQIVIEKKLNISNEGSQKGKILQDSLQSIVRSWVVGVKRLLSEGSQF